MDENQLGSDQEPTLSPTEIQARDSGWVPKEEYNGEEHKWVDAGEFLRRGELFKKIGDQSKQLKDMRASIDQLNKLNKDVREAEFQRALDSLKVQKRAALVDGDADAVIEVDERIDIVKEEVKRLKSEATSTPDSNAPHPDFVAWTDRNSWYNDSTPMRAFADALGRDLAAAGNSPPEVLRKVEQEIRKEFPHKFRNPNQDKPGAVESTSNRATNKSSFVLTDEERRVMNTFVRTGALTEKEYIESLKKVRG
jgi:hypothetical protein